MLTPLGGRLSVYSLGETAPRLPRESIRLLQRLNANADGVTQPELRQCLADLLLEVTAWFGLRLNRSLETETEFLSGP